jgi:hypothetical protein
MVHMRLTASVTRVTGRAVHLVDVENLLGTCRPTTAAVAALVSDYVTVARVAMADLVIVACSHITFLGVAWAWSPSARLLVRSGPDGADLALIEVITAEGLPGRFDRVVVGSGDGVFAEHLASIQAYGLHATVVSRPESLSRRLRLAVGDIRFLPRQEKIPARLRRVA